ncbi:MAG: UvrD-helicase domain-containing protein [Gemmatimonadales bacterium]
MSPFVPTPGQREVILSRDEHLLVAAGAGSGKTGTVIQRLLYLLGAPAGGETIPEPVPLEKLSAITFTLSAAAELKRKLRTGLVEAGKRDLAHSVDTARIGTIHSFCGDVLREFALRRGTLALEVLQEGPARALAEEAARDAVVAAVESGDEAAADLLVRHQQKHVHAAMLQLLDQGDRLRRLAAAELPDDETVLVRIATTALGLIEQRLRALGAVDFDRMLTWTRDLLRDDDYARRTLQRRIHTLIIDEFQDVDPVQWEIARLLGDPESGRADTPRLLLVGDPKQSIYRFRNADVATWHAVARIFAGGAGRVVPLDVNFRSTAPILDFVAATVGVLLDEPIDAAAGRQDFEVDFARLEPGTTGQADGPAVELIATPVCGKVDEARGFEAEAIAERAVALHEEGVAWKDMALLLPAWTEAERYQEALGRRGIPCFLLLDEGFYERREVIDQILALEAVRDPRDDLALMGFLRSPFVGVRDETLLALAQSARPYWNGLSEVDCPERGLLERGRALLELGVQLRDRVPIDELLSELLRRSGYWAHLALLGEARALAVANVRKFLTVAREAADLSVGDFLRGIAAQRDREDRVGYARLYGETDDVVTISTVHSAKGLEWDAVFWCDLVRDTRGPHPKVLIGRHAIALKDPDSDAKPQHWTDLEEQLKAEDQAEKRRLWYVASTRAKQWLIVSPFPDGWRKHCPSLAIADRLGLADEATLEYPRHAGGTWSATVLRATTKLPEVPEIRPPLPVLDPEVLPSPVAAATVPSGRPLHSATEALVLSRCEMKHWFQYVMGLREPPMRRSGAAFGGAVARGQIVHDVLEQYRIEAELGELIDDAIRKWDPDAPPPETSSGATYRRRLRVEVEAVANNPEYREVADLPGAERELAFLHLVGRDHGWQGSFDLAGRGPVGWWLLDVKTGNAADADAKAERYAPQRQVYVRAAEAISSESVEEFRFVFSERQAGVRHRVDAGERAALPGELARLVSRMESGRSALTTDPKECEHCGFKRVRWCPGVEVDATASRY